MNQKMKKNYIRMHKMTSYQLSNLNLLEKEDMIELIHLFDIMN
jgi:hypothetical protein